MYYCRIFIPQERRKRLPYLLSPLQIAIMPTACLPQPNPKTFMALLEAKLRVWISGVLLGSISTPDLTQFVQFSRRLITAYISAFRGSTTILAEKLGITMIDLAYDCIAEAFARNQEGRFFHLERFVESLTLPINEISMPALLAAYRVFLSRFADAQIGRLYAVADPTGARISRNIRECIKWKGGLDLKRDFRGWLIFTTNDPDEDHLPPLPLEELKKSLAVHARIGDDVPRLMESLAIALKTNKRYRRSIPLRDVVQIFREYYELSEVGKQEGDSKLPFESLTSEEIDGLRHSVEGALKEKLFVTYVARKKLAREEAEAIFLALSSVLKAWCGGDGLEMSLYESLRCHMGVSEMAYREKYRVKMEYLLQVARDEFVVRLNRDV
jgi:hypothetical protein